MKKFPTAFTNLFTLIVVVARGIVVIMDGGKITDTILQACEAALGRLAPVAFINRMLMNQTLLSFLVPSSAGLAVLSMPIFAPWPTSPASPAAWL